MPKAAPKRSRAAKPKAGPKPKAKAAPKVRAKRRTLQDGIGLLPDVKERKRSFNKRAVGLVKKAAQLSGQCGAKVLTVVSFDTGRPNDRKQFVFFATQGEGLNWFACAEEMRRTMLEGNTHIQGMYQDDWDDIFGGAEEQWRRVDVLESSAITHAGGVNRFEMRDNLQSEFARQNPRMRKRRVRPMPEPVGLDDLHLMVVPLPGESEDSGSDSDSDSASESEESEESEAEITTRDVGTQLQDHALRWAFSASCHAAPLRRPRGSRLRDQAIRWAMGSG